MTQEEIAELVKKANGFGGCMAKLRTMQGRRRKKTANDLCEEPLSVKDDFVADEAKLRSSKAYRVQFKKTQVFTLPENPLVRLRGTHVEEVQAISVIASEMLGLNTSLVRAAAVGHDIGHVPLGHQGEEWIAKQMGRKFCHEAMGVIVAQKIERKGLGLNLCHETLEAMYRHSGQLASEEMTPEAWVVRYCDKFAYIFHDFNDFHRAGLVPPKDLLDAMNRFGRNQRQRTTTALCGLIVESAEQGRVSFEKSELGREFQNMRKMMYEIYPRITTQDVDGVLGPVLDFINNMKFPDPFLILALMTDSDVLKIKNHTGIRDINLLKGTTIEEVLPHLNTIGKIDMCDPDLDW